MAWKVPSQGMPSATGPASSATRSFISRAALLVKVTARMSHALARPVPIIWAMRVVNTRVFPVPAPARTSTGPSIASTASRCSGFSASRYRTCPCRARARSAMPPGRGARASSCWKSASRPSDGLGNAISRLTLEQNANHRRNVGPRSRNVDRTLRRRTLGRHLNSRAPDARKNRPSAIEGRPRRPKNPCAIF